MSLELLTNIRLYLDELTRIVKTIPNIPENRTIKSDDRVVTLLYAIMMQESDGIKRIQDDGGPARSLWQFEGPKGGVGKIFEDYYTQRRQVILKEYFDAQAKDYFNTFDALDKSEKIANIMRKFEDPENDKLAAWFARMQFLTREFTWPEINNNSVGYAWSIYKEFWRPRLNDHARCDIKAGCPPLRSQCDKATRVVPESNTYKGKNDRWSKTTMNNNIPRIGSWQQAVTIVLANPSSN
jgi:hypothetical protein